MAQTTRTYTGTGSPTVYDIDFDLGYLSKDHIYVYQGDDYTVQLSYTYVNDLQIQVDVTGGEEFVVRRVVPRNVRINDYTDGAFLAKKNLNGSFAQPLMIIEEIQDGYVTTSGDSVIQSTLDMRNNAIVNCLEVLGLQYATESTAAVPLQQVEDKLATQLQHTDDGLALKLDLVGGNLSGPLSVQPAVQATQPVQLQQLDETAAQITADTVSRLGDRMLGVLHVQDVPIGTSAVPKSAVAVMIDAAIYNKHPTPSTAEDHGLITILADDFDDHGGL